MSMAKRPFLLQLARGGSDRINTVSILLKNGANVNTSSNDTTFPLLVAARTGSIKLCRPLLDCGADITMTKAGGLDVFAAATEHAHWQLVDFLKQRTLGSVLFPSFGVFELVHQVDSEEGTLAFECR